MSVVFIFARFDESRAAIGELIGSQRTHKIGLSAWDIAEVVTVFCHNLNSIGVILIVGLWNQGTLYATNIAADALTVVDAGYLQDAEVVVDRKPTTISTTLWQRPSIAARLDSTRNIFVSNDASLDASLNAARFSFKVEYQIIYRVVLLL